MPAQQFKYFIITIPAGDWNPPQSLSPEFTCLRGQKEEGDSGYLHWQVLAVFCRKLTLHRAKFSFPVTSHLEPTRSDRANGYVWKEETRVEGTQFELGQLPIRVNNAHDWDLIWQLAVTGRFLEIPANIRGFIN